MLKSRLGNIRHGAWSIQQQFRRSQQEELGELDRRMLSDLREYLDGLDPNTEPFQGAVLAFCHHGEDDALNQLLGARIISLQPFLEGCPPELKYYFVKLSQDKPGKFMAREFSPSRGKYGVREIAPNDTERILSFNDEAFWRFCQNPPNV